MKKEKGFDEILDNLFSEEISKERLLTLGFSEDDAVNFLKLLHQDNSSYMRILDKQEREGFTADAIIYLLSLLQSNAIDRDTFEEAIAVCMQIVYFSHSKINKKKVDTILSFIIFNEAKDVSLKEMIELFVLQEYEVEFDSEVH